MLISTGANLIKRSRAHMFSNDYFGVAEYFHGQRFFTSAIIIPCKKPIIFM